MNRTATRKRLDEISEAIELTGLALALEGVDDVHAERKGESEL